MFGRSEATQAITDVAAVTAKGWRQRDQVGHHQRRGVIALRSTQDASCRPTGGLGGGLRRRDHHHALIWEKLGSPAIGIAPAFGGLASVTAEPRVRSVALNRCDSLASTANLTGAASRRCGLRLRAWRQPPVRVVGCSARRSGNGTHYSKPRPRSSLTQHRFCSFMPCRRQVAPYAQLGFPASPWRRAEGGRSNRRPRGHGRRA